MSARLGELQREAAAEEAAEAEAGDEPVEEDSAAEEGDELAEMSEADSEYVLGVPEAEEDRLDEVVDRGEPFGSSLTAPFAFISVALLMGTTAPDVAAVLCASCCARPIRSTMANGWGGGS